jgi:pilus assembly protein Flp/PilA
MWLRCVKERIRLSEDLINYFSRRTKMLELFVNLQSFIAGRKAEIEERGATAVEYALMVGLIAVGIIGAVVALKNKVGGTLNKVSGSIG